MILDVEHRGLGISASVQLEPQERILSSKEFPEIADAGVNWLGIRPFDHLGVVRISGTDPNCVVTEYHTDGTIEARQVRTSGDVAHLLLGGLDNIGMVTIGRPGQEQIIIRGREI